MQDLFHQVYITIPWVKPRCPQQTIPAVAWRNYPSQCPSRCDVSPLGWDHAWHRPWNHKHVRKSLEKSPKSQSIGYQWHQAAISDYMIEPILPQQNTFKKNTSQTFTNCSIFRSQEDWKWCWSGQKMFSPVQAHPILHFSFKVIGFALDSSWDVMLTSNNFRTVSGSSISFMGEPSWPKTPMIMSRKQAKASKVTNWDALWYFGPMDQVRFQPTSKRFLWLKGAFENPAAFGFPSERD